MCTHTGFSYCHPGISSKLDAKSAILSESLDSFSWGTWCHPSDELQPAAWQANPAKAINYFEQFAHQLHSARRPTLFSFLCPGSYHHPPVRAPTRVYMHAHKNARFVAPMRGTLHAYIADTEKTHTCPHTYTDASQRPRVLLVIQRRYRVTSCKAMYIQPGTFSFELSKGRAAVVNIHRTLFSARVPAGAFTSGSIIPLAFRVSSRSQARKRRSRAFSPQRHAARPRTRRQVHSRRKSTCLFFEVVRNVKDEK